MTGSPSIANLNVQAPLPSHVNVGLNLNNDTNGLLNTSSVLFMGGYTLPVAKDQFLRFGLSAGLSSTKIDINALNFGTAGDPLLAELSKSSMRVISNFGISFHSQTFHIGASIPNIFQPDYVSNESFAISKLKPFETLIFNASNRFYLSKGKYVFEPYVVYRLNSSLPSQFEVAGVFHMQNLVYVGGSYKQDFGISALAGIKLNKISAIGYSYTLKNTGENELNRPSHEVHVALLFGKQNKKLPVYSFVDTEKVKVQVKTPQQIAAEKKRQDLLKKQEEEKKAAAAAKVKEEERLKAEALAAAKANEAKALEEAKAKELKAAEEAKANANATTTTTTTTGATTQRPRFGAAVPVAAIAAVDSVHMGRLDEHAADPTAEHNETHHPNAERHETVKQGGHKDELEVGDYVIAGAFKVEANAKKYSDGLKKLGFTESDYGFLTEHTIWYVHIAQSNDIDAARAFRDKFRKMKIFREAWLLTVQK